MFYINSMKKGLAISIQESTKGASLQMTHVFGDFGQWFRAEKPEKLDFSFDRADEMSRLAQYMQMRIVQKLGAVPSGQKDVPVMVGIQPSICPKLGKALNLGEQLWFAPLSNALGLAWTDSLRKIIGKKSRVVIGIWAFIDELDEKELVEPAPQTVVARLHELVRDVHNPHNLEILEEMAFQDWKNSLDDYRKIRNDRLPRFTLYGHNKFSPEASIIFNYLKVHPALKMAFVEWILSHGVGTKEDIHHTCVKTPSDPKAPPYSNIAITMLADECARDEGKIPLGHVQEIV